MGVAVPPAPTRLQAKWPCRCGHCKALAPAYSRAAGGILRSARTAAANIAKFLLAASYLGRKPAVLLKWLQGG